MIEPSEPSEAAGPFLRWAGGKRWLIPRLLELVDQLDYVNYHEPFLGGGAAFFGLHPIGKAYLYDLNADLIEAYTQIARNPTDVYHALMRHRNTSDYYYRLRRRNESEPTKRAANFIFLNQTSFNGIYRVNLKGEYNVPFGYKASPKLPSKNQMLAISRRLKNTKMIAGDFTDAAKRINSGDLVFIDPPYTVAHNNNGFVKYNQKIFSYEDQIRLKKFIELIRSRGAYYIMTNASHKSVTELFDFNDRVILTKRRNVVGGKNAERGLAIECLFTNVPTNG